MIKETISIILPIYNGQDTIDRCLESIISQTYKKIRIICINDGSTDQTKDKLLRWKKKYPDKITIINNLKNIGITKSLNIGLKNVKSEYFSRIDVDDWWAKDKLSLQYEYAHKNSDVGLIGSNYVNLKNNKNYKIVLPENDNDIRTKMFKRNPFAHSCVFIKTSLVKQIGGYNENIKYGQDYDLWFRLFPLTKYHNIQQYLCFREVKAGISKKNQKNQMLQSIKTQIKYIKLYNASKINYLYLIEPALLVVKNLIW